MHWNGCDPPPLSGPGNEETDSPRAAATKPPPAEAPPSLPPSQSAAWEAMSGPAETRGIAVQGAQPKWRVVGDAGLTGDAAKDETMRRGHTFEGAPSAAMLKVRTPPAFTWSAKSLGVLHGVKSWSS
jgi:hypothetical protein